MELALSKYGPSSVPKSCPGDQTGGKRLALEQGDIDLLHTATGEFEKDKDCRNLPA